MIILIINDDRNQQETFCEVIRRIDPMHKCLKMFSPESALEFLLEPDYALPDLIFLDFVFRINDGRQMLREIKNSAILKDIPVCIYTNSTKQADRDEAFKLGAIAYVVKEPNLGSLSESIIAVIELIRHKSVQPGSSSLK